MVTTFFLALVLLGANIIEKTRQGHKKKKKREGWGIKAFNGRAFFFS
jgi:hypothetical protein